MISSCDKKGIGDVLTISKNGKFHAVIQIPSGSAKIYEYDYIEKGFKNKIENYKERKYNFLPLPFNYAFIPSTKMLNGSNDKLALESVVLSEMYSIGTLIETDILGALEYTLNGNKNILIIQNPIYDDAILIKTDDINSLQAQYNDIINIIKIYFKNNYNYEFSDSLISKKDTEKIINKQIIRKI